MTSRQHTRLMDGVNASEHCLVFGLPILLFSNRFHGYVGAEGFGDHSINVLEFDDSRVDELSKHNFRERVFIVTPPQQNTAAAALKAFLNERNKRSDAAESIESRLRESVRLEDRLNDQNAKASHGQVVQYGQSIQLLHLMSKKYLTVRPRLLAATERDAMKVELSENGMDDAHFQVNSAYGHIAVGDEVFLGDDIVFTSATWQVKLHVGQKMSFSKHLAMEFQFHEINASSSSTVDTFVIQRFAEHPPPPNCLCGNDIVRFVHCTKNTVLSGVRENELISPELCKFKDAGTYALWQVQFLTLSDGSAITSDSVCCIRHMPSRQYLYVDNSKKMEIGLTSTRTDQCHFKLHAESPLSGEHFRNDRPLFLHHIQSDLFLGAQDGGDDTQETMQIIATKEFKLNAFRLQIVAPSEVTDSMLLLSLLPQLQGSITVFRHILSSTEANIQELIANTDWITNVLLQLTSFCYTKPLPRNIGTFFDKSMANPLPSRQRLLAEMDCISVVIDLVQSPFRGVFTIQDFITSSGPRGLWHTSLMKSVRMLCHFAYRLLFGIVRSHAVNGLRCISCIDIILEHVGLGFFAEDVMIELLNMGEVFIAALPGIFLGHILDKIHERGKQAPYLVYLTKLCASKERAFAINQTSLCTALFDPIDLKVLYELRYTEVEYLEICMDGQWVPVQKLQQQHPVVHDYIINMIKMLASMCASRNYIAIYSIEKFLPRDLALHGIQNPDLADTMRWSFCRLLRCAYIDRLPQQIKPFPQSIQVAPNLRIYLSESQQNADCEFIDTVKQAFMKMLGKSCTYSGILLGMLQICFQLIQFGHFAEEDELENLLQAILPLLHDKSLHSEHKPNERHLSNAATRRGSIGFNKIQPLAVEARPTMFFTASNNSPTKINSDSHDSSRELGENKPTTLPFELKCKLVVCRILSWSLRMTLDRQLQSMLQLFFSHPENGPVAQRTSTFGLPFLRFGERTVSHFKSSSDEVAIQMWNSLESKIAVECKTALQNKIYDKLFATKELSSSLFNLLSTDNPDLVSTSLDLIGSAFNTHRELLKHLDEIIVISHNSLLGVYDEIKRHGGILQIYDETSETWLSTPSGEIWQDLLRSLHAVIELLSNATDKASVQMVVRGLNIDELVLSLMESIGEFLLNTTRTSSNKVLLRRQERLLDACYHFLVLYAWDNLEAQNKLAEHLPFFQACVAQKHIRPSIFIVLTRKNLNFCQSIGHDFLTFIISLINDNGHIYECLDILSAFTVCNGIPIKENQTRISLLLMEKHLRSHVLEDFLHFEELSDEFQFHDNNALDELLSDTQKTILKITREPLFDRMAKEVEESDEESSYSKPVQNPQAETRLRSIVAQFQMNVKASSLLARASIVEPNIRFSDIVASKLSTGTLQIATHPLLYYSKLLELLSNLTLGANFVCEARLQGLMPIDSVLWALLDLSTPLPIKTRLLTVLHEAWVNTEQYVAEVAGNLTLQRFVGLQYSVIHDLFPGPITEVYASPKTLLSSSHGHGILYIFSALVPMLVSYARVHCDLTDLPKDIKMGIFQAAHAISSLTTLLENQKFEWNAVVCTEQLAQTHSLFEIAMGLSGVGVPLATFDESTVLQSQDDEADGISERHLKLFVKWLQDAPFYKTRMATEKEAMLDTFMTMGSESDFNFMLQKLVAHAKQSEIQRGIMAKHSTLEILLIMEQITSSSPSTQALLQSFGADKMIVNLYCQAHESDTQTRAALIALAIALLQNGNHTVQAQFYQLLNTPNCKWFERVWYRINSVIIALQTTTSKSLYQHTDAIQLLEVHRLFCEGHNSSMQNLLRQQDSTRSINIVSLLVKLFNELVKHLQPSHIQLLAKTLQTIVELIQGPCEGNQLTLIEPSERNSSNFIDMVTVVLSLDDHEPGYAVSDISNIKYMCTLVLVALVEGRRDTIIHERMASLLSLQQLKESLMHVYKQFIDAHDAIYSDKAFDPALLSPEARLRDNYVVRLIKIVVGQAHLPVTASKDNKVSSKEAMVYLNAGFNIYILFHRLLQVPGVGQVLRSSVVPSDDELRKLSDTSFMINPRLNPLNALHTTTVNLKVKKADRIVSYAEAFMFFRSHCASIEVVINPNESEKQLHRFYFPKPPVCQFLTSDMRDTCMANIKRDSPGVKVADLFERSDALIAEMTHRYLMVFAGDKYFTIGKAISFILAITINVLLLSCYVDTTDPRFIHTNMSSSRSQVDLNYNMACIGTIGAVQKDTLLLICGILQAVLSSFIVFLYAFTYGPLIMLEGWKRHVTKHSKVNTMPAKNTKLSFAVFGATFNDVNVYNVGLSLFFLLQNPVYIYYCVYVMMSIIGNTVHPFFFAFHLFDVFLRFPELTIVVHAIASPYRSLILTFALIMIAEYLFSIFGFAFFRHQYSVVPGMSGNTTTAECGRLWSCYFTTLDQTFKSNGGIGGHLTEISSQDYMMWWSRLIFDNLFNLTILLVLVNIFFGIIIDTFGNQRTLLQQRLDDMTSKCFICSIDRESFDRYSSHGFEYHCKREHHLWNYVFLVAHLRFKNENDYDGVEQYLWSAIQNKDYSFMPLYNAIALQSNPPPRQT